MRSPTPAQICVPVLLKPEPESATTATAATETVNGIYMFAVISQWAAHTTPSHLLHPPRTLLSVSPSLHNPSLSASLNESALLQRQLQL